ncbi:hypothetical protein B0T16DRAFT_230923 [Cercophora newfieldiana]|uniref:Extracellular membrane protein CFEM domain-containing protein n=1 Tax=Cercophora newfieldiana TaxID=92897 RepID=A0AA40CIJ3_9PEZI|nr:hypothetical protein B0T16DRAFT_230923 [Cercophora newfieldiana]
MSLRRLAHLPLPCLTLVLACTSALVSAQVPKKISAEVLNFVPPCAQSCFQSFILTNLESSACGDNPSLACLCRQSGKTGHTIGEGAVACIAAESARGSCKGNDASLQTQATSYNMCVGIANAAPKTHSTIVATLVVPTGTGGLSVPTPRPTGSTSAPAQDITSVLTPTSAAPTASISSAVGSSPVTPRPSDTSAAVVPDDKPVAQQQQLSSAQIVGIVLGCLAVVVFGILLVFLARCVRRRRFGGDPEAGFTKMRDSLSFGRRSQPASPPQIQISKPLHSSPSDRAYQWPSNPPQKFQPMQQPPGVGLAISPFRAQQAASDVAAMRAAQNRTPTVVLSPPPPMASSAKVENAASPKPALTLAIPAAAAPKPNANGKAKPRAPNPRESIVTEFAEDGEGDSLPNTGNNIWRPPPTDPQSATTYFFADKGGNWILRNKSDRKPQTAQQQQQQKQQSPALATTEVELPSPSDKTKAERAQGWFSPGALPEPLRVPSRTQQQQKLGSPISFKDQQAQQNPRRDRSSSVYSPSGYNPPVSMLPGPRNPLPPPDTYFAMIRDGRDLTGSSRPNSTRRKSSSAAAARKTSRRRSTESTTSIESAAAAAAPQQRGAGKGKMPYEDEALIEDEMQVNLSPVVESPSTPLTPGQSPVTYPKIRRRDAEGWEFPMPVPRQQQGAQLAVPGQGQGSRKLGVPPALNPNVNRNPALQRTGSPEIRQGVAAGSGARYQGQQQMVGTGGPYELATDGQQMRRPSPAQQQVYQQLHEQRRPSPAQQQLQQQLQESRRPSPAIQQLQEQRRPSPAIQALNEQQRRPSPAQLQQQLQEPRRPSPAIQQLQEPRRPSPATTSTATPSRAHSQSPADSSSSLLAKRRGAEKAAALSLADQEARRNKPSKGWKREDVEVEAPPITPGIRMMTPRRIGDDIILDVRR